jgi:diguanylate cyclase (GGDEF)-like protein/PAS domain S-box-containing protein
MPLLTAAFALAAVLQASGLLARADLTAYDLALTAWPRAAPRDIVIVAIDDRSISELGRWPWPRRRHAQLLDRLTDSGVRAVGLDIPLREPDRVDTTGDAELVRALQANGRTVLSVAPVPRAAGDATEQTGPLAVFASAAAAVGHVEFLPDEDAVVRSVFLKAGPTSADWPALPVAMLKIVVAETTRRLPGERGTTATALRAGGWVRDHRLHIPFAGPPGRFHALSFVDVLRNDTVAGSLRGKHVLVGVTAKGLHEAYPTPQSGPMDPMPSVEISANVLDTLRQEIGVVPLSKSANFLITLAVVLAACLAYPADRSRRALFASAAAMVAVLVASYLLMRYAGRWFAPGTAIVTLSASYLIWAWSQMRRSAAILHSQQERSRAILNAIGEAVVATDRRGHVTYVNPGATTLLGVDAETAGGVPLATLLRSTEPREQGKIVAIVDACLSSGQMQELADHAVFHRGDDRRQMVRAAASPVRDAEGTLCGAVLALSDVTESLSITARMMHQATHDALTELPNRTLLQDRLNHAISNAQRGDTWVGVMFLDLDGFKRVNDSLGHSTGDGLLKEVAKRLKAGVRTQDTVARWGGDEFVFIVGGISRKENVARLANKILKCFQRPFRFDSHELYVTASIGISLCPKDGEDAEELLKKADAAMYRVKDRGRNAYRFYSEDINSWTLQNLAMEQSLHRALKRGELELFFQPQVSLVSGDTTGVEALLRWHHPHDGLISPSRFIPLAEENGLIHPIGDMVIQTACKQARAWAELGPRPVPISINVSPRQFARHEIARTLGKAIHDNGIDPGLIKVEITETTIVQDVKKTLVALRDFKALGVRIAIDDFGTGFSSLTHLKRFPIDELKIDQSFVRDITNDPDDAAIAQAIIALARSMNLTVVAEGVETEAQMTFLRAQNCHHMQGYYFSHPRPAAEIPQFFRQPLPGSNLK